MFSTDPTPYDLRFNLGRIPVRVHWMFWVASAAIGWRGDDLDGTLVWVLAVFVSVLAHEWGHAITAERFGWQPSILLYYMGGLAFYSPFYGRTPLKQMAISAMGPIAGFLLSGLSYGVLLYCRSESIEIHFHIHLFLLWVYYVGISWGIFNLIPVLPLDGGHIMQSALEYFRFYNPHRLALQATLLIGGAAAFYFLSNHYSWAGIMMIFFVFNAFQELQARRGY